MRKLICLVIGLLLVMGISSMVLAEEKSDKDTLDMRFGYYITYNGNNGYECLQLGMVWGDKKGIVAFPTVVLPVCEDGFTSFHLGIGRQYKDGSFISYTLPFFGFEMWDNGLLAESRYTVYRDILGIECGIIFKKYYELSAGYGLCWKYVGQAEEGRLKMKAFAKLGFRF